MIVIQLIILILILGFGIDVLSYQRNMEKNDIDPKVLLSTYAFGCVVLSAIGIVSTLIHLFFFTTL